MGILNLTPDSFSDGSEYLDPIQARDHALRLQDHGADILDVGPESSRPGAEPVPVEEQISRLSFFFDKILPSLRIPVSIDTRSVEVAEFAVNSGASIINDVSGLRWDTERMLDLLKRKPDVAYVLMHSRGNPQNMFELCNYKNLVEEVKAELKAQMEILASEGIHKNRLLIDLGLGFAKKGKQNLNLISCMKAFEGLGCPLMLGISRKSFLMDYFDEQHPRERILGTEMSHFLALQSGAKVLRVHDVAAAHKTIRFFKDCY